MLRAVIFDLGETLFHEHREEEKKRLVEIAARYTGSRRAWANYFYRLLGLRKGSCEAGIDTLAYYYAARHGSGKADPILARKIEAEIVEAILSSLTPVPGAREVVEELAGKGYRLAIISNASSQSAVEALLEKHGMLGFFDVVVTSRLVGVRKPDPRIFHYTLLLLGLGPSQAVYVGDRGYEDVYGAKNAGLYAIHLAVDEEASPIADVVVESVGEVVGAVEKISKLAGKRV